MGANCSKLPRNPEARCSAVCHSALSRPASVFPTQVLSTAPSCQVVETNYDGSALGMLPVMCLQEEQVLGGREEHSGCLEVAVTAVVSDDRLQSVPPLVEQHLQQNTVQELPNKGEDDSYASVEETPTSLCSVLRTTAYISCRQTAKPTRVSAVNGSLQLGATSDDVSVSMDPCLCPQSVTTDFRTSTTSYSSAFRTSTFERMAGDVINLAAEA